VPDADTARVLDAAIAAVPGGSSRPGQQRMAAAISQAIESGEHLLIQAGTGTGKSLGYLAPALASHRRTVVSTATLALQAQLVNEDLPRLAEAVAPVLGRRPTFAVLKGRHHYLCLARLDASRVEEQEEQDGLFSDGPKWVAAAGRMSAQVTRLREWADQTDTGDRSELDPGVDDLVWRTVSTPARECVGATRCPFGAECHAEAARQRARDSDIVVTNHALLAVDMAMTFDGERRILPEHELLIIDEAHDLTDRVTSAAQAEFSPDALGRAAKRANRYFGSREAELLDNATEALRTSLDTQLPGRMASVPDGVRAAVLMAEEACQGGLRGIGQISTDDADLAGKHQAKATLQVLVETAQRLLLEAEHDVIWMSVDERGKRMLVVAPLSVASLLGRELFRDRVVVATSATLALGGQFDAVSRSLGLPKQDESPADPGDDEDAPPRWHGEDVGSPFDYPRQGILYVASHLPRPGMSGLSDAAAEELVTLVQAAGGRTLGLFSSRKAAAAAAEILIDRTDLPILLQGDDSLPLLVRKFKEDPATCLLGVMSLWQGVDVPGPACQLVVIDRLPFPRPDDPLTSARAAAVDASGGSGFAAVSVPIAAIRLAQGAGRLVRTTGDRGVVAVLDPRLATQRYGTYLRKSVPPFWYTTKQETVLGALKRLSEG
jgi:ATP-dependent DNA helicase DinG